MIQAIHVDGVRAAMHAFEALPRAIALKHVRIALNAGAGVIRDRASSIAIQDTGILSRSLGVKVKVPDASFNKAHHGRPAYAVIGPKRNVKKYVGVTAKGKNIGLSAKGVVKRKLKGQRVVLRKPSRYAHLVENDHLTKSGTNVMGYPFMDTAARTAGSTATAKMLAKLKQGAEQEAQTIGRGSVKLPPGAR